MDIMGDNDIFITMHKIKNEKVKIKNIIRYNIRDDMIMFDNKSTLKEIYPVNIFLLVKK